MRFHTVRAARFPLLVLLGLLLLLVNIYVFLAAGWLDRVATVLVLELTSGEEASVGVYGLRSDLFWRTSADSVVVRGPDELVVRIAAAGVRGSAVSFLMGGGLDSIGVGLLEVGVAETDSAEAPDSLSCILEDIRGGFVTSANMLTLEYGYVHQRGIMLVDSMSISTSVDLSEDLDLQVSSATVHLPDVGLLRGTGHLGMRDCDAFARGFEVNAAPGELRITGSLYGENGGLDLDVSGRAGPDLPWLDFPLRLEVVGRVFGTLKAPRLSLSLPDVMLAPDGEEVAATLDSLALSRDSVSFAGLRVFRHGVSLVAEGAMSLPDLAWRASMEAALSRADLALLVDGAPSTSLNGSFSMSARGSGAHPGSATISAILSPGRAGPVSINSATLNGQASRHAASLSGTLHTPRGTVAMEGSALLGVDMIPTSYEGALTGQLSGSRIMEDLALELPLPTLSGISFQVDLQGTMRRLTAVGRAAVASAETDSIRVSDALFNGGVRMDFGGAVSVAGSLSVASILSPYASADGLLYAGSFATVPRGYPELEGRFSCDSVGFGAVTASMSTGLSFVRGRLELFDLQMSTSNDYQISGELIGLLGDTTTVELLDLTIARSKMRLVSRGLIRMALREDRIVLDTVWLPTPHGEVLATGDYSPAGDSLTAYLRMDGLDLAAVAGLLAPHTGISGIGNLRLSLSGPLSRPSGSIRGRVMNPSWGPYLADSLTLDAEFRDTSLVLEGLYSWDSGIRSGVRGGIREFWNDSASTGPALSDVMWAEVELTEIGDWLFYALPIPIRTRGATVSANAEYTRNSLGEPDFDMHVVATAEEMIITALNQRLPNVSINILYSYPTSQRYSARLSLSSATQGRGSVTAQAMFKVLRHFPTPIIGDYYFRTALENYRVVLGSYASVSLNGEIEAEGQGLDERPLIQGDVEIAGGYLGMPETREGAGSSSGGGESVLPFDMLIRIRSSRGLWFRNTMADLELTADLVVLTQEGVATVNGELSVARGSVYILQKDFRITEGVVSIQPGVPPSLSLNITAETSLRGIMDRSLYTITVRITGSPQSPEMVLSGSGPGGELSQEDILSLLATGLTYAQLQQVDSGALGTGLEDIAQGYIGKLLARSLRDDIGVDAFDLSPELLSDSTSFRFNVGKYVLPELFVSYEGDVLSSEPGTVSAQYFIGEDVYLQGSTKPTLHGNQEPSLELHYTFDY